MYCKHLSKLSLPPAANATKATEKLEVCCCWTIKKKKNEDTKNIMDTQS